MSGGRLGFSRIFSIGCIAVAAAFTLPARAFEAIGRFLVSFPDARVKRFIADLTRGPAPLLALGGEAIGASLYNRSRHEAGIARLGAVRHT